MKALSIAQYAQLAGVSKQAIYNRIYSGHIATVVINEAGYPSYGIDTSIYPVSTFEVRQRGRKKSK